MLTTAGVTLATSVATSGVPGSTGGVANGAGVAGADAGVAAGEDGFAAWAKCRWQPAPRPSAVARTMGPSFRVVMLSLSGGPLGPLNFHPKLGFVQVRGIVKSSESEMWHKAP